MELFREEDVSEIKSMWPFNLMRALEGERSNIPSISFEGLEEVFKELTEDEASVLVYRFRDKMILRQVGRILGKSPERIRQIEGKALRKLRNPIRLNKIKATSLNDSFNYEVVTSVNKQLKSNVKLMKERYNDLLGNNADGTKRSFSDIMFDQGFILTGNEVYGKLEELELSTRAYNCLKKYGIQYALEIMFMTEEDLLEIRNLGVGTRNEVMDKIKEIGIELITEEKRFNFVTHIIRNYSFEEKLTCPLSLFRKYCESAIYLINRYGYASIEGVYYQFQQLNDNRYQKFHVGSKEDDLLIKHCSSVLLYLDIIKPSEVRLNL